jgi:hypothetical protein
MELFAFFMWVLLSLSGARADPRLTGVFSTLLLPETKGLTLEDLSQESQEDFVKEELPKRPAELQG